MSAVSRVARILDVPALYAFWQRPFIGPKLAIVRRHNQSFPPRRVLDIGCGPGVNCTSFAASDYCGIDLSARYIAAARRRFDRDSEPVSPPPHGGPGRAIRAAAQQRFGREFQVGDARELPLTTRGAYDFVLLNSLLHHLSDEDAGLVLRQAAAALTPDGHVHVIDLVLPAERGVARLHARLDRGDFPRPLDAWRALFREAFEEVVCEPFSVRWLGIEWLRLVYFKGRLPGDFDLL